MVTQTANTPQSKMKMVIQIAKTSQTKHASVTQVAEIPQSTAASVTQQFLKHCIETRKENSDQGYLGTAKHGICDLDYKHIAKCKCATFRYHSQS